MNALRRLLRKIRTWSRLLYGFCPECNSDAPEIDTCDVCGGYRWGLDGTTRPPKDLKDEWLKRYNQKHS